MIFKLTDKQIAEIIEMYGSDEYMIKEIEKSLNMSGKVRSEEDYYELAASSSAQMETLKFKKAERLHDDKAIEIYLEEIVESEINRKYNNPDFEESYEYFFK